ncbi:uncharacterized protein LOC122038495 isoform X1 [Zingiber officinale]|uniref:Uncharacterized protein n=2 Tax=Zingiber officinale TaxID=94328 RepID=A0A8J5INE0_ZINOF|nr:uncharacterized protein LOC122011350 isoform X1 [Zingiber officinale]XP_042454199.1 uncharacterized protein LOC122038495 isoform X1 [Zingiber officinale]KAG6534342.1 hypothetical protein ZIOFF_008228 [Zingiber officinale]KAG6538670.1 hypothetical protein ZIOFF_003798 [Zingiber officinale]
MTEKWRGRSNLQSFLDSTTPSMPSHKLPKSWCRDLNNLWQMVGKDSVEFFNLGDLWEQYCEWSAYGAGVPVCLQSEEMVVQYYVPYLSSVQIYTNKAPAGARDVKQNGGNNTVSWNGEQVGHLYLEFSESTSPYGRVPLLDKVLELSHSHPGLFSFKSTELSPASWMSVAWYPIYHIPTRRSVKELSVCFLTYHTLSSFFQDEVHGSITDLNFIQSGKNEFRSKEKCSRIYLPPFGLATYKLQGNLWTMPESGDQERITSLFTAADSWLKKLKVQHHDFTYFTTHFL